MKQILVLCTGNSCRSQIAEGFLQYYAGNKATVFSAGIETHGVNPRAIATMQEIGLDISQNTSNHINEYKDKHFDFVITVCDHAKENCPFFPTNAQLIHVNFKDPAKATGTEAAIKAQFALVREEIAVFAKAFCTTYL